MKKLLKLGLFISLLIVIIAGTQSPEEYFVTALMKLESKGSFVLDADTFNSTTQVSSNDTIVATRQFVLNQSASGNGWDSLTYSIDSLYYVWMYDGNRLDSIGRTGIFIQIADSVSNKPFNYVTHNQLDSAISQGGEQVNFWFILPANASLVLSAQNAIGLPPGWTVSVSGSDLIVNHNLGRGMMAVHISNSTTTDYPWRQYRTFGEGYTGLLNTTSNSFTIEGIISEYTSFNLRVQISFEQ